MDDAMIWVHMIVGGFDEPFLVPALNAVMWADRFAVLNTDPDSEHGRQNARKIHDAVPAEKLSYAEYREPLDFAAARNASLAMIPDGDFVLLVDSDDLHYPEWKDIAGYYLANGADSITAAFYHLVVFRDACQAVYPREIVFRKYADTQFVGKVHEQLHTTRRNPVTADYRWVHASYLRPQADIFARWKLYSDLVGDFGHYAGQNPDHIIDDRVSVATRFTLDYPPAVAELIEEYPVCPVALQGESEIASPKVGLVVLWTDEDKPLMADMLPTLGETEGQYELYTVHVVPGDSLARALNKGFHEALAAGCEYVGWIHPDHRFDDPGWLSGLLHELRCWPKVGKVCAANTRDNLPADMIDGHEQAYLVRATVLREIGLFDERFEAIGGREDWDFNRRLLNAGYRCVITPRACVYHEGMATRARRDTTAEQVKNAAYYEQKWGTRDAPV